MKTFIFTASLICAVLSGCSSKPSVSLNQEEEKMVGKYYYATSNDKQDSIQDIPVSLAVEVSPEYYKDKTSKAKGKIICLFYPTQKQKDVLNLTFEFEGKGKWEIKDGYLKETIDPSTLTFNLVSADAVKNKTEKIEKMAELFSPILNLKMKEVFNDENNQKNKIIELDDNRLILEDENGEQTQMSKIS